MATQTKEEAIESVKDGNREYYDKYLSFAKEWVKTQFKPFNSECMKKAYFELGNAEPEQPNVIGAVFRYLSKEKLILYHSHTEAKNPAAHGRSLRQWISAEYSIQQSNNRKNNSTLNLFENGII